MPTALAPRQVYQVVLLLACAPLIQALPCPSAVPLQVRMEQSLSTLDVDPGTPFTAIVVSSAEGCDGTALPAGTRISGSVQSRTRVGLGFVHERASLELGFDTYTLPGGATGPLIANLKSVDNARERVNSSGSINGILAANRPQRFLRGVWYRPDPSLLPRTLLGLTGTAGRLFSATGPVSLAGVLAIRFAVIRMPDPEISLPRGAELNLEADSSSWPRPDLPAPPAPVLDATLADQLFENAYAVQHEQARPARDRIHLAFSGSRDQIEAAFLNAGWTVADRRTRRSFGAAFQAFLMHRGYPSAPVSRMYYEGVEPELVFQKSLNTVGQRHHIRIWQTRTPDNSNQFLWIAAATHDTGLLRKGLRLTHAINPSLDLERDKVIADLQLAGCNDGAAYLERPQARSSADTFTDGRLAWLQIRSCTNSSWKGSAEPASLSRGRAFTRRLVLETRQYLLRDNFYHYAFLGFRGLVVRPLQRASR